MEIIIGREEGARRLHCIANGREFNIGSAGCVPNSVSRKHCKIIINEQYMSIENLKDLNVTFVDGVQILSKAITVNSNVQLGNDKYNLPLKEILELTNNKKTANTSKSKKEVPSFSLSPLEAIWEEYDRRKVEYQKENAIKADNQRQMMGGRIMLSGIPVVGQIANALMGAKMLTTKTKDSESLTDKLRALDEELDNIYVCPNPECRCPFGPIPYRRLKFRNKCAICGCKYTTDTTTK